MFVKKPLPILMTMLQKASNPVGIKHVRVMTSLHCSFSRHWRWCIIVWSVYISLWQCDSFIPWSKMSDVKPFTIISGGANGVDLEPECFASDFGLPVQIFIPPCHPRSKYLSPLTHSQLGEAIRSRTKCQIASTNLCPIPSAYNTFTKISMWWNKQKWY